MNTNTAIIEDSNTVQLPVRAEGINNNPFDFPEIVPWPESVDAIGLLDELAATIKRFVVMPPYAAQTLALWILHTYAFTYRDVSTYIGIESPEKRCGKTTLLNVLAELVHHPVTAANISSSAFFRVIHETQPTLIIDEADTFLNANTELGGILNAGYRSKTAYVMRFLAQPTLSSGRGKGEGNFPCAQEPKPIGEGNTSNQQGPSSRETERHDRDTLSQEEESSAFRKFPSPSPLPEERVTLPRPRTTETQKHRSTEAPPPPTQLARFSSWCPKVMATIGRFPDNLADRCILIRMQRKLPDEPCERLRDLDTTALRRQCERFVRDHQQQIASAQPVLPSILNDRAADIWEPLLVLADLAGGHWPETARQAATALSTAAQETNPVASLLLDIFVIFALHSTDDRIFTKTLLQHLGNMPDRPWAALTLGKQMNNMWLSSQLRPYGIKASNIRINDLQAKGYHFEDFREIFRRYLPKSELESLLPQGRSTSTLTQTSLLPSSSLRPGGEEKTTLVS